VAARIVKVLGADCGLDPSTKMLSKVSAWMETSPLVLRIYGELYCPPHSWDDLAGGQEISCATFNLLHDTMQRADIALVHGIPAGRFSHNTLHCFTHAH